MKILIIGATSAIAKATARLYAEQGQELFLVARNEERLLALANDLKVRGADSGRASSARFNRYLPAPANP